ncbi:hypothetical protein TCAL_08802, partial [Tigriopus californicus]
SEQTLVFTNLLSFLIQNESYKKAQEDPSLFFTDGKRRIDLVLAFHDIYDEHHEKREFYRDTFIKNIMNAGLHVELENKLVAFDNKTSFLKIHGPEDVLDRNGKILNLKPPIKSFIVTHYAKDRAFKAMPDKCFKTNEFSNWFKCDSIPTEPNIFHPGFFPDILDKYVLKERSNRWSQIQRTQLVWQILNRMSFDDSARDRAGIQRLIGKNVFSAAYGLHDGDYDYKNKRNNILFMNERMILYDQWATLKNWYKKQPLWLIKKYFGVKIGLYFAWLGFYTKALIVPAIVGLVCFAFGILTIDTKLNQASEDICNEDTIGNSVMCPQCDNHCPYWNLKNSCFLSKVTYVFDNNATVFFSIFMSFWATTYLELWKRQQAILQWEWDLKSEEEMDDTLRPEFIHRLCCVMGAVSSLIVFRVVFIRIMYQHTQYSLFFSKYAKLIATSVAAVINAVVIEVGSWIFQYVARRITDLEHPRTQSEYENSYTFKMFLFQFINYYSSLIYTAFFKGRFFTYPGDAASRQNILTRLKTDMCDPAGCLFELIMKNWFRRLWLEKKLKTSHKDQTSCPVKFIKRWEMDYQLQEIDRLHLFDEYIEIIVQYGFVTLFVAAFPLAPLLALINNIFEIRLDAYKYTTQMRRPLGQHVRSIGIWYGILKGMTYLSVVFNAFVIALASDFIPRMVYIFVYSPNWSLDGYVNSTLASFDTKDWGSVEASDYFGPPIATNQSIQPYETCRYRAYRSPPGSEDEYSIDKTWLHVFSARLGFVAVFEHMILVLTAVLAYMIPEVPNNLQTQVLRERHQEREIDFDLNLMPVEEEKIAQQIKSKSLTLEELACLKMALRAD